MCKMITFFILFCFLQNSYAQTILNANGPGNTYELIQSVLAPNYNPIEVPDCNHIDFGRHIDEVFDSILNEYVFRFHIHKFPDNDRCINFDRQRNEIKAYDQSPDDLLGIQGETVIYRWKFRIEENFQPSASFTHLHQLKAVDGPEDGMPMFTITARKASPDRIELRYAESTSQITVEQVALAPFLGEWIQAEEQITYGEIGSYQLVLKKISDGTNLITYNNDSLRTWRTDASFVRPKWGIYRSLNDSVNLKDELIYFNEFYVEEIISGCSNTPIEVCEEKSSPFTILAESGYSNYQWYKDGLLIAGENTDSLVIIDSGTYHYTVDELDPNDCNVGLCCPLILDFIPCCPEKVRCLSISIF